MCKISCDNVVNGLNPNEKLVSIKTADGKHEEVLVSRRHVHKKMLMAAEIGRKGNRVLVELPRESSSGRWRLWVKKNLVGC